MYIIILLLTNLISIVIGGFWIYKDFRNKGKYYYVCIFSDDFVEVKEKSIFLDNHSYKILKDNIKDNCTIVEAPF